MVLVRNYLLLSILFFLDKAYVGFELVISLPVSQMFMTLAICPFIPRLLLSLNVISILHIKCKQLYSKC